MIVVADNNNSIPQRAAGEPHGEEVVAVRDHSVRGRSGPLTARRARVCACSPTNSMEAAAEEGEVPAEVPRAVFAHAATSYYLILTITLRKDTC